MEPKYMFPTVSLCGVDKLTANTHTAEGSDGNIIYCISFKGFIGHDHLHVAFQTTKEEYERWEKVLKA